MQIRFDPFILDLDTRQLLRAGREIHISPKAFELLTTLVSERPKAMSKADLQERLWPNTFVVEANLSNLIAEIRESLDDQAESPRFLRTARGFGYAFCANVSESAPRDEVRPPQPQCWLEWGQRRFPLSAGEHVIGRDPDVDVRLDATTVSRRHARVVVTDDDVMIEDFDSKNGTFRGDERVTAPVPLTDGDNIRIGSLVLTFHVRGPGSTETMMRPLP